MRGSLASRQEKGSCRAKQSHESYRNTVSTFLGWCVIKIGGCGFAPVLEVDEGAIERAGEEIAEQEEKACEVLCL